MSNEDPWIVFLVPIPGTIPVYKIHTHTCTRWYNPLYTATPQCNRSNHKKIYASGDFNTNNCFLIFKKTQQFHCQKSQHETLKQPSVPQFYTKKVIFLLTFAFSIWLSAQKRPTQKKRGSREFFFVFLARDQSLFHDISI